MEIGGEKRAVSIRLLESGERIRAACDLINNRYAWRGYGSDHRIPVDAYHMTFTAEVDGKIIGTITLAVDSAHGLAADTIFKDEIDGLRALPGREVCELTRFAFDPGVRSRELMAALFHIVFVYGHRTHGCTDLVIEVSPRHARFYEAMLGFRRVGVVKMKEEVATRAQLMWLEVATIRERIDQLAGRRDHAGSRSLYPFFLSPDEESGIYRRLSRAAPEIIARPWETSARQEMELTDFIEMLSTTSASARLAGSRTI